LLGNQVADTFKLGIVRTHWWILNKDLRFQYYLGIAPAKKSDFVVKEHIYTMCPGCPTFSIPIPIPVASLRQEEFQKVAESKKEEQVKQ